MYHEVDRFINRSHQRYFASNYYLSEINFDLQMKYLIQNDISTLFFHENFNEKMNSKMIGLPRQIVITFDDGYQGNYECAFSILKKYNLKAIFFVVTKWVGKKGMMTWEQLRNMGKYGMSIQSHTHSHKPLQSLSGGQIEKELVESKKLIEDNIQKCVTSISLPHGSINRRIIELSIKTNYKFIFTSEVDYYDARRTGELLPITIVPRIPVRTDHDINTFGKLVSCNSKIIKKIQKIQNLKKMVKSIIGIKMYRKIYDIRYGIKNYEN
jgi:peptidoglycan/xylan/chitin deacetylase (PgdA/CDA1 family)